MYEKLKRRVKQGLSSEIIKLAFKKPDLSLRSMLRARSHPQCNDAQGDPSAILITVASGIRGVGANHTNTLYTIANPRPAWHTWDYKPKQYRGGGQAVQVSRNYLWLDSNSMWEILPREFDESTWKLLMYYPQTSLVRVIIVTVSPGLTGFL